MTKKRIAVDMDEVIADSIARFHEWYGLDYQLTLTLDELQGKHFHEAVAPEHQAALREYPNRPGFFKDLPVIADSQRVLREINQRYELFIATAAMEFPSSFLDKYEWLRQHFPFIPWRNVVFCGDKSILNADYLIDDNAFNFDHFRGEGILFDAPHNAGETRYRRVRSWQEVGALFL
ncbi:5'(3')-deoxyribonucleotidase [Hymenobacter sp. HSC-4F20]|uniref:5' nucleotidase, NT5C type n=1 Tax=Hymenobacter sp. HSC-4F20 TaxID=2864135 RepID=UPI001C736E38|nr:5'(3')-deoxyribonucleotidase [Hymenobacter sp. HSC-4F20]MBX0292098.1 5'(3')-deoxyribonucleotidase [Hymenobacter sp. HSC-4F20]